MFTSVLTLDKLVSIVKNLQLQQERSNRTSNPSSASAQFISPPAPSSSPFPSSPLLLSHPLPPPRFPVAAVRQMVGRYWRGWRGHQLSGSSALSPIKLMMAQSAAHWWLTDCLSVCLTDLLVQKHLRSEEQLHYETDMMVKYIHAQYTSAIYWL